jgi:predicted metal-binding membrane protein
VQLTGWKARQLACCRGAPDPDLPADAGSAWRHGLRLGGHCALCCCGFMLILLVSDVMDIGGMALVAAGITFERLAPVPTRAARITGAGVLLAGVVVIAHAVGMA